MVEASLGGTGDASAGGWYRREIVYLKRRPCNQNYLFCPPSVRGGFLYPGITSSVYRACLRESELLRAQVQQSCA
jgi:hypothetical protein